MSYIPDYRDDIDKLDKLDRAYWDGYKAAMEDAKGSFGNVLYEFTLPYDDVMEAFEEHCECNEIQMFCSIVEGNEAYEDVEFTDSNEPLFYNTKGAKA